MFTFKFKTGTCYIYEKNLSSLKYKTERGKQECNTRQGVGVREGSHLSPTDPGHKRWNSCKNPGSPSWYPHERGDCYQGCQTIGVGKESSKISHVPGCSRMSQRGGPKGDETHFESWWWLYSFASPSHHTFPSVSNPVIIYTLCIISLDHHWGENNDNNCSLC